MKFAVIAFFFCLVCMNGLSQWFVNEMDWHVGL